VSIDLQTVIPQEAVELSSVRMTQLAGIKALEVLGSDFRAVDEVFINDMESPDVMVLSKTKLIAQLPEVLQRNPDIQSVNVLSRALTVTERSLLRFRIGDTPGRVSGLTRLVQLFVKILLTTPGSDIFNPKLGGGALSNVGRTFGLDQGNNIKADFTIAVDRTVRQIIAIQSKNASIPRDERLMAAKVLGATFSRASASLFVTIELLSQGGNSTRINLEV
jgi:hypothetical protein